LDDIDEEVKAVGADKPVQYRAQVGAGYFVSVRTGCNYVDFPKFYMTLGQTLETPTDEAIQLPPRRMG